MARSPSPSMHTFSRSFQSMPRRRALYTSHLSDAVKHEYHSPVPVLASRTAGQVIQRARRRAAPGEFTDEEPKTHYWASHVRRPQTPGPTYQQADALGRKKVNRTAARFEQHIAHCAAGCAQTGKRNEGHTTGPWFPRPHTDALQNQKGTMRAQWPIHRNAHLDRTGS